jgi:hypothetical protein
MVGLFVYTRFNNLGVPHKEAAGQAFRFNLLQKDRQKDFHFNPSR